MRWEGLVEYIQKFTFSMSEKLHCLNGSVCSVLPVYEAYQIDHALYIHTQRILKSMQEARGENQDQYDIDQTEKQLAILQKFYSQHAQTISKYACTICPYVKILENN